VYCGARVVPATILLSLNDFSDSSPFSTLGPIHTEKTWLGIGRRHGAFSSPSHVNKRVNAYRGDGVGARHSEASAASLSSPEWRLKATRSV
jgi:hypothetical protein